MRSKLLLILALLAVGLQQAPAARAQDEVNLDYFYTSLQDQGDWFSTDNFGYVFQPRVAADRNWRPYTDGYWSFTDEGWTWISYEDFGWATYHYGRWTKLASVGWVWVPGYEWAPAWVSWRTGADLAEDAPETAELPGDADSDFIGWAPLPPNAVLYPGVGLMGGIDQIYDIPPENYCFVPTPYFCAPALIVVIVVPARNYFCIGHTINVTHCRFGDRGGIPRIYCGGPNFARVQRRVPRPVPQFTITRRPGVPSVGRGSPALLNEVRGHRLEVIAPRIAPPAGVAASAVGAPRNASSPRPARVKAEIARAEPVAAWNTAGVQPQAVQAAREQFKREAAATPRRAVTPGPPQVAVANPSDGSAGTTRAASNSPPPASSVPAGSYPPPNTGRVTEKPPAAAASAPAESAPLSPQDAYRRQQAAERARRDQIVAEQQRRAAEEPSANEDALEAQRRSQSEAQARMQALREQQSEQARQAQAATQAQRQQQFEAQRQAQIDRQRRTQAEAQSRAEAQREVSRQQQQADQQRRAAEAQRRMESARGAAQGTQTP